MNAELKNHWIEIAGLFGIPLGVLAFVQLLAPLVPGHASIPSAILLVLVFFQLVTPWKYRKWKEGLLGDYGRLLGQINLCLCIVAGLLAIASVAGAYFWHSAPKWLEEQVRQVVKTTKSNALTAVTQTNPIGNVALPDVVLASISSQPAGSNVPVNATQSSTSNTPNSSSVPPVVFPATLYKFSEIVSESMGSTKQLSDLAIIGVFFQVLLLVALLLVQPIAEHSFSSKT